MPARCGKVHSVTSEVVKVVFRKLLLHVFAGASDAVAPSVPTLLLVATHLELTSIGCIVCLDWHCPFPLLDAGYVVHCGTC